MEKIGVIILNYLNFNDTIECIESLKIDNYSNKEVIIVDNGSTNESWNILYNKYKNTDIHLIKSETNEGFARGNNIGIKYARNTLDCKFVLLINNDTIITDDNMIRKLMDSYETKVAIIGPRIISADGIDQNPISYKISKQRTQKLLNHITKASYMRKLKIYDRIKKIKFLVSIKNKFINIKNVNKNNNYYIECSDDLILHGACMLLTKDYFEYYEYLYPNTFLYCEEDIISLLTKKVNLNKKFINYTSIYHKEDQSSVMSFENKSQIKLRYSIESIKKYIELFDMDYYEILEKYFKN